MNSHRFPVLLFACILLGCTTSPAKPDAGTPIACDPARYAAELSGPGAQCGRVERVEELGGFRVCVANVGSDGGVAYFAASYATTDDAGPVTQYEGLSILPDGGAVRVVGTAGPGGSEIRVLPCMPITYSPNFGFAFNCQTADQIGTTVCRDSTPVAPPPPDMGPRTCAPGLVAGPGEFVWTDRICGPSPTPSPCIPVGDGCVYKRCATDSDCTDPDAPKCSILGLFGGGDFNCNAALRVCRAFRRDECPAERFPPGP